MSIKLKDTIYDNIDKLSSSAGGTIQPIYFLNGKPTNCSYTLGKSVPSDAKFTDTNTTYSQATSTTLGLVKIGYSTSSKNYAVQLNGSGQMYVNVPWTDTDTKYTLPESTTSALGGIKIAKDNASYTVTTNTSSISANITSGKYYGVELDKNGKAFVYVPWTDTNTIYTLPKSTTSTLGGIKIAKDNASYTVTTNTSSISANITSGKYYGVELDKNGKAFVYVPWTDTNTDTNTTYSAGSGLSLSGTTFNHISTVTAGTAGTSSATSGSTISIPYVTVNATGHVTGYGTRTHTVTGSGLSGSNYVAKTGDVMTGSLELPNSNSALKIGTSSFTYGSSLVQIKARNNGEGYSLLIERENTDQQAFIGFPCRTVNNGGDSIFFGVGKGTNGALSSIIVCSNTQKSACGLRIQGEGSSVSESYINYFTKFPGKDPVYRASTGWSSLFGNAVSGAFLLNGQNDGFIVVDDDSHFLKTNRIFRSLIDYTGSDSYSAEFLTYTDNPYGIIIRSNSSGMQSIQSQREANNSEVFPLVLNPFGGYVGINNSSPKCSLDTGTGYSRSRFYYFSDKSSSGEAGFVGRGSDDDTIYLGAYNTNNVHVYSDNGSIYLRSNHGIVIGLASEVGSPRALLDVRGYNSSVIIGDTGGYSFGTAAARKLRLGLGTVGHKGSQYWAFCVDDTTSNSYLQIGYNTSSTAMSIRHDGLVDVSSFAIGGQVITFTT